MVSPVMDVDVGTLYLLAEKLEEATRKAVAEIGWIGSEPNLVDAVELARQLTSVTESCLPILHKTRSCTSCASFVCLNVRTHFLSN
jgi:hypothetical protein